MPISHTPQMRSIQLSHKSRTNGSATFQTVQTVGRPLLPGRPMTLCQVDEHTSRDYATSHSWCATHSLSKRPSFSAWWLLAPWQWSSPLGSLLVLFRFYTWFLDLFLCTAENLWKFWHTQEDHSISNLRNGNRYYITVALYKYHKYITGIL